MTSATSARMNSAALYDEGLRSYMLGIFNRMGAGLLVSGLVALLVHSSAALTSFFLTGPMLWLVILSPLAFVMVLSFGINRLSLGAARTVWWSYCTVMGISLSTVFAVYTGASIALTFFITAAMFGGMSLYGYTTKADLTRFGSFLFMALLGLLIAMIANLFIGSSLLHYAISAAGVLIFTALTAYDVQTLKEMYDNSPYGNDESRGKLELMGALTLYLDFVNLFQFLLQFIGVKTND